MKVGIIGTGAMGNPMAHHILRAGHALAVFARRPEKVKNLENEGAKIVASPADVGLQSEFVILSLPFDPDVEEVVMGERGVIAKAARGTLILDTTTGTPQAAVHLAAKLSQQGIQYLDAPISGGVKGAREAKITFMVGGEKQLYEKAMPLMKTLGANIYHIGPLGTGRAIKALNQIIAALNTLTLCETVVLGKRLGISPETFFEVLSKCAANSYHLQTKLPQFIIPGKFDDGHRIEMMVKDLEIALQVARDLKTSALMTGLATQIYRAGASAGYAAKDISAMANFLGSFVGLDFTAK
jgi:3-hydroxyisobutyrate dehydrogenase-like beta-hydroxyacid dehydrogenase